MENIHISTESKTYPVVIGPGAIHEIPHFLNYNFPKNRNMIIITDKQVAELHLPILNKVLKEFEYCTYITPVGEAAKTFDVYYNALSFALEQKLDRGSVLLAFGGGAIGDLGGFIAATYLRGIPFIQIPTTILAHDSAVGGKVAINHPIGKNMIGSFYQPEAVFYDLDFLNTLPLKEKRSGFAEVIKHALIQDYSFYEWLVENIRSFDELDSKNLQWILSEGIKIKGKIVSKDEKEHGDRAFLNFGHTLGHAIEAEMGYGKMSHGEAVIIGMVFALNLSIKLLNLKFDVNKFTNWLLDLGYSIHVPSELSINNLLIRMKQDKKSLGEEIRMILLSNIGEPILLSVTEDIILRELKMI